MNARQILQALKDQVEQQTLFTDKETTILISGNETECSATMVVPIEGKNRLYKVVAKDLGIIESLEID